MNRVKDLLKAIGFRRHYLIMLSWMKCHIRIHPIRLLHSFLKSQMASGLAMPVEIMAMAFLQPEKMEKSKLENL